MAETAEGMTTDKAWNRAAGRPRGMCVVIAVLLRSVVLLAPVYGARPSQEASGR